MQDRIAPPTDEKLVWLTLSRPWSYNKGINSGITVTNNLKPWQPGKSGNPAGRPKGARSWHKVVHDLLNDEELLTTLDHKNFISGEHIYGCVNAGELIAVTQIIKALEGDSKAADWLLKMHNTAAVDELNAPNYPIALVRFI